jgi:DNA-binding MarR family transcriptional regulator
VSPRRPERSACRCCRYWKVEIAAHFEVSWPAISQNIKVLRAAGLLKERREGTRRLYRVDRKAARPLEALLRAMWERDLDRLTELAEAEELRLSPSTPSISASVSSASLLQDSRSLTWCSASSIKRIYRPWRNRSAHARWTQARAGRLEPDPTRGS